MNKLDKKLCDDISRKTLERITKNLLFITQHIIHKLKPKTKN